MMPVILKLNLDAHYPVPAQGNLMLYKGIVYKIISSTYIPEIDDDCEYRPEYLALEVIDCTSTEEGQVLLADEAIKQDHIKTIRYLKLKTKTEGTLIERVDGELVTLPERNVLFDSFNIYGSGERLIETETEYWYLINNGMDGDDWGRNAVRTGGAGAYGWRLSKHSDADITTYALNKAYLDAHAVTDLCGRQLSQSAVKTVLKARAEGTLTLISVSEQDPNREQYICTETGLLFEAVTAPRYLVNLILDHKKEV